MEIGWIIALWAVGLVLLFTELFVPGLVVGTVGTVCIGVAVYLVFAQHGVIAGLAALALSLACLIGTWVYAVRRLTVKRTLEGAVSSEGGLDRFVGREGITDSALRPVGIARVDGRRLDVVTRGEMIDRGARVRVIEVEGNRVVVKKVG